jgi:hypothetical protein
MCILHIITYVHITYHYKCAHYISLHLCILRIITYVHLYIVTYVLCGIHTYIYIILYIDCSPFGANPKKDIHGLSVQEYRKWVFQAEIAKMKVFPLCNNHVNKLIDICSNKNQKL